MANDVITALGILLNHFKVVLIRVLGKKRQMHWSYVTSNKYIVLSTRTCITDDKSHNS